MRKRPLFWAALLLVLGILLVRWMGISWIWRSPAGTITFEKASEEEQVLAEGIVFRQEEKSFQNKKYTYLYLKQTTLDIHSKKYPIRNIKCIIDGFIKPYTGYRLSIPGKLTLPAGASNPGGFDQGAYERTRKIDFHLINCGEINIIGQADQFSSYFAAVRKSCAEILEQIFPRQEAGILEAMLLGEKGQLEEEVKDEYQAAGISHVLAISGLHISLLGMGIWGMLKRLGVPMTLSAVLSIVLLGGYGCLIGSPTTAFRALVMFAVMLAAKILGRVYDLISALCLAAFLLLVDNPDLLFDSGFQLSFMAVMGVGMHGSLNRRDSNSRGKLSVRGKLLGQLHAGVFLWLFTLPVVLHSFYQVSLIGIFCNLLVIPLLPAVLGSGVLSLVAGRWGAGPGSVAGTVAYGILRCYAYLGYKAKNMSMGVWTPGEPSFTCILLYYLVLIVFVLVSSGKKTIHSRKFRNIWQAAGAACLILLMAAPWRTHSSVTMLDVGQGDGIVLQEKTAQILIDGGSTSKSEVGNYVILPFLKQQGISSLEAVFLSHSDQDHMNGALEVLEEARGGWLSVDFLFMPAWMEKTEAGQALIKAAGEAGTQVKYLQAKDQVRIGEMKFDILYPKAGESFDDPNEGSMVFVWEACGIRGLFTGDLPVEEEKNLLNQVGKCDFLKVGHHGSNGSTGEALLTEIHAEKALISCGKNNRYGHPGAETLERLEASGCEVYRTDLSGAVTLGLKE